MPFPVDFMELQMSKIELDVCMFSQIQSHISTVNTNCGMHIYTYIDTEMKNSLTGFLHQVKHGNFYNPVKKWFVVLANQLYDKEMSDNRNTNSSGKE